MIALFIVIGACLGIAAFVLVLTSKQSTKCPTKEKLSYYEVEVGLDDGNECWGTSCPQIDNGTAKFCDSKDCTGCKYWDLDV